MLELDRLQRRRQLGVSLADRALQKYHQRLPMTMHNATLLLEENSRLRTENTRQKRKRAQRRVFLQTGGAMTVEEGMASVETVQKDQGGLESHPGDEGGEAGPAEATTPQVRKRAQPKCSICRSIEHNARKCPNK